MMKFKYWLMLALINLSIFQISASAQPSKTFKIATSVQANGTAGKLLKQFADNVEKRSKGSIKFKIFHGGILGNQLQYFQHIQRGVIDIGLINSASLESVIPSLGVMNMPYLFRSVEEYREVMNNKNFRQTLFQSAKKHNFGFLGYISSDFRSIYSTKPIKSFHDLAALRLRTISSPTYMEMLSRFGAVPTALSFGELYAGMQQGVVDGAEGGIAGIHQAKFSDVAKHVLVTEHTRLTDFVISSIKFEQSLSAAEREIISEEFSIISNKSIDFAEQGEKLAIKKLIAEEGVTFYPVDKAILMDAVKPMYLAEMQDEEKAPLLKAIFKIEGREF
jgi:tripartite ATP-independent transporter DctP family solute receptor